MGHAKQVLGAESGPQAANREPEKVPTSVYPCLLLLLLKVIFSPPIRLQNHDKLNNNCIHQLHTSPAKCGTRSKVSAGFRTSTVVPSTDQSCYHLVLLMRNASLGIKSAGQGHEASVGPI